MKQYLVTLQDGLETHDLNDIIDRLMGVRGVYSVECLTKDPPKPDPRQQYLFGDAETLQRDTWPAAHRTGD